MIDIIIPVHNITHDRDISRLKWSVYSLNNQTVDVNVIVVTSSKEREQKLIKQILRPLKCKVVCLHHHELNMPLLHTRGLQEGNGEYIGTTGADFIFKKDCIEQFMNAKSENTLLLKQVLSLPKTTINERILDRWMLPSPQECVRQLKKMGARYTWCLNEKTGLLNKIANGALQFAHRSFWEDVCPPPLVMSKLGAYDNYTQLCAEKKGYEVKWITRSTIGHLFHKISQLKFDPQFTENIRYVNEYKK